MYYHRIKTRGTLFSKCIAYILVALMLLQNVPVYAEVVWSEIVSDPVGFSSYHMVTFEAGEDTSSVFVADGGKLESFPEVKDPEGKKLLGWYAGNTAVSEDTAVITDLHIRAVFTTVDSTLEEKKASAKYKDTKEGTYATVSVFGNNHTGKELKIKVNTEVFGGTVLEAWTVDSIQNKSDLTLEAVITALPDEGVLSAYTVIDDQIVRKVAEDLAIGDRVSFDLSRKGAKGIALVLEEEKDELLVEDNVLWANDEVYITGQLPGNGIVVAEPLTVEIEGEKVISAYSIQIYANEKQREKGKAWHPTDKKVQVHFYNDAFSDNMNIYYVGNNGANRIDTVDAVDGWVVFEADNFFAYAITRTIETVILASDGHNYRISVAYTTDLDIPADAQLSVTEILGTDELYEGYASKTRNALGMENDSEDYIRLFDISIVDKEGKKIQLAAGSTFNVSIELTNSKSEEASVVHFADENDSGSVVDAKVDGQTVSFETEDFNVYAVVYTVDFHWEVNGKTFEMNIPGGGFITLRQLVEGLNITESTDGISIDQFVAKVENVQFSNPDLVWVGRVEDDSTVGQMKLAYELESRFSAALSTEQIEEINNSKIAAGEWLLISLKAFDTEESLTVTMNNGEEFVVKVTDAQIKMSGKTTENNVEIRKNNNLLSAKVTTIPEKGTRVILLDTAEGILGGLFSHWYQIEYTDEAGVVYAGYVDQSKIEIIEVVNNEPVDYDSFTASLSFEDGVLPEGSVLAVNTVSLDNETIEAYRALIEAQLLMGDENKGVRGKINAIEFFDLSVFADGSKVQPNGEVLISLALKMPIALNVGETLRVIHFKDDGSAAVLPKDKVELTTDEDGFVTDVSFFTDGFSTYALATVLEQDYIARDGNLYHVTVTYGADAQLPEGVTLRISEFDEESDEYAYARNSVLADKKARGEWVDLSSFRLAALDISILNAAGEEIEPEAPVQVNIRIKELPGVEDLSEITSTLAIQHHVEVEDGIIVETVFDGSLNANFLLQTDETIAEEGTTVNPSSVSDDDFNVPIIDPDSLIDLGEPSNDDDDTISFETPVFSVFTLTWKANRVNTNNTVNLSWKNGTGRNAVTYGTVRIHYYDTDYNPIQPPVSDRTVTQPQTISLTSGDYVNIPGYAFSRAWVYYDQQAGTGWNLDEVGVQFSNYNYYGTTYRRTLIQHGGENYKVGYYQNYQAYTEDVYLYFENTSTQIQSGKVHYGYMDGSTFVEFPEGTPSYTPTYSNQYQKYLIYDVDGYQYSYTYRNSMTDRISPYVSVSGSYYDTAGSYLGQLSNNDNIYLVYEPHPPTTQGGTPKLKEVSAEDKPDVPDVAKSSVVNGDGTNTLSLSVTGHTKQREVEKLADVIVIFDVSGSMKQNIDNEEDAADGVNDTNSRMYQLKQAVDTLSDTLLSDKYKNSQGDSLIRMSLVSFSNIAQTLGNGFTEDADTFKSWVGNLGADGGTNWEAALKLANTINVDPERATFVIFVTDGEPTFRYTRGEYSDSELIYPESNSEYDITDYYIIYNVFGGGNQDLYGENYAAALVQAKSIVGNKKNLFTIGIGPSVTSLEQFGSEAGAGGNYTATSSSALEDAFDDITAKIVALMGYSDIKISDGITSLTQIVQKSTLVNFAEDDFTYFKKHDYDIATQKDVDEHRASAVGEKLQVNGDWEIWDPTSEGCGEAVYNTATGAVEWDMGEGFMLEEGYTYQGRFKVWPSQDAYDLLADLNNGKKSYDSLSDVEKAQISEPTEAGGMYTLKTNSDTSYTYREATKSGDTVTPTGDPSEPGSFPDVDPLKLTTRPLKVKKQWHNNYTASREPVSSITMELYGVSADGSWSQNFKKITLSAAGNWQADDNFISYGLVTYNEETNGNEKIYETGHDFTLREIDDEAHYYELTAGIFRPMFINNVPTILERLDTVPAGMSESVFHYYDGSHHYYRLDGKVYQDTLSDTLLIATNSRRSYMDLNKVVVDESGVAAVDDEEFEYKITFTVPDSIDNYDTVEKYIWFSVYDSVARRTLAPSEYTCTGVITPAQENAALFSGPEYANYLVATSGNEVTMKIKQGWNVRFLNLPIGTTYSFEEINIPEGYNFVKAEVSGTRWIANMVDGVDRGSAQDMSSLPANNSGNNNNTVISGTIDFANARYSTTYTNKTLTQKVNILKTSQDGTTALPGAVFSLYTENGYGADPKEAAKTDLTSDGNGGIELGALALGKYYLAETNAPAGYIPLSEPIIITVSATGVTYNQNNSLSLSNGGVNYDETTKTYTLTVTNNVGIELPSTGGPGTGLIYLLGLMLTGLAGTGLMLKRRRRNAA